MAEMEEEGKRIGTQRKVPCVVRYIGGTAYFFEVRHTKPDLSKVALKAMYDKAKEKDVPLRTVDPSDAVPPELDQLVKRANAGDSAAIKQLKAEYIHTSHLPVLKFEDFAHAAEPSGKRTTIHNQPSRAIVGSTMTARSTK